MTKAEFQQAHGSMWAQIVRQPAFLDAIRVCGSERLNEITNLSPEQIELHGRIHLANFQGHLQTEATLLSLALEMQGDTFDLPPADYGVPEIPEVEPTPVAPVEFQRAVPPKKQRKTK